MRADNVVSNTSPILNLALIERLDPLESQFQEVVVPQQVWEELPIDEKSLDLIDRGSFSIHIWPGGRRESRATRKSAMASRD